MREIDIKLNQLADMLLNNEITPEEHVDRYNEIIQSETDEDSLGWQPHEHCQNMRMEVVQLRQIY